jgi:hypothetical protein
MCLPAPTSLGRGPVSVQAVGELLARDDIDVVIVEKPEEADAWRLGVIVIQRVGGPGDGGRVLPRVLMFFLVQEGWALK